MLRFGKTYVMTRHVVSVALSGDWLEIRTVADTDEAAPAYRFQLRVGDHDEDVEAMCSIASSTAALAGVVDLTPFLL